MYISVHNNLLHDYSMYISVHKVIIITLCTDMYITTLDIFIYVYVRNCTLKIKMCTKLYIILQKDLFMYGNVHIFVSTKTQKL